MFNRYRRCCCQNDYNPEVIETLCNNVGTTAEFAQAASYSNNFNNNCNCGCNYDYGMNTTSASNMMGSCCDCGFDEPSSPFPTNPMLAQSYVPIQEMNQTFTPHCGLKMGTIFPELVSPYVPCQSMAEIEYLKQSNEIGEGCNQC